VHSQRQQIPVTNDVGVARVETNVVEKVAVSVSVDVKVTVVVEKTVLV